MDVKVNDVKKIPESLPKPKSKDRPPTLKANQIIAGVKGNRYLVESMLGKGGFGEVYKVSSLMRKDKKFALKVEPNITDEKHKFLERLKVELHVFEAISRVLNPCVDTTHFVKMHDKGKTETFKYYVMDLVWISLKECVRGICKGVLSPHSKIIIARQTLTAIETLHEIGFLHRDIKPGNFLIGLPPNDHTIYMVDFGLARPFRDPDGAVKLPRIRVNFIGTLNYSSIAALEMEERSRKDDLESWMYMMIELYDKYNLVWRKTKDRVQLITLRKGLIVHARSLVAGGTLKIPMRYVDIIAQIGAMTYYQGGNFQKLNAHLTEIVKDEKINESLPLDWVGKRLKSPEKRKKGGTKRVVKKEEKTERTELDDYDDDDLDSDSEDTDEMFGYDEYLRWKSGKIKQKRARRGDDMEINRHKDMKTREEKIRARNKRRVDWERRGREKAKEEKERRAMEEIEVTGKEMDWKIEEMEARNDKNLDNVLKKMKEEGKPVEVKEAKQDEDHKNANDVKPAEMDKHGDKVVQEKKQVKDKDRKSGEDEKEDPKSRIIQPSDTAKKATEAAPVKKDSADKK